MCVSDTEAEEDARKACEASLAKPKDGEGEDVDESKQLRTQLHGAGLADAEPGACLCFLGCQ